MNSPSPKTLRILPAVGVTAGILFLALQCRDLSRKLDAMSLELSTIQRQHLRRLLGRLLDPAAEPGRTWHVAPAAKYYHQAYRHGLIEHSLSVAQGVSVLAGSPFFPGFSSTTAVSSGSPW